MSRAFSVLFFNAGYNGCCGEKGHDETADAECSALENKIVQEVYREKCRGNEIRRRL